MVFLSARAPAAEAEVRKLSLTDCYKLALEKNLDLQIQRISTRIQDYQLAGSYAPYDPTFSISPTRNYVDSPRSFDPKKPGADVQYHLTTDSLSGGLDGKLPTGMSYHLGSMLSSLSARSFFTPAEPGSFALYPPDGIRSTNQFAMMTGVSFTQPLLKDFWIDSDRLKIQLNKKNLQMSEIALVGKIMQTVASVANAYYELHYARASVAIHRAAAQKAGELLEDARTRIQAQSMAAAQATLFEYNLESAKADLASAENSLGDAEAALRNLLTDDLKHWGGASVELSTVPSELEEAFDQVGSWRAGLSKRPEVRLLQLTLDKSAIQLRYDRNQLYPSLDLVGSYSVNGIDPSLGTVADQNARAAHSTYTAGVVLSIPLTQRNSRNNYKADKEARAQALLHMKQLEMGIMTQIENDGRNMQTAFRRLPSLRHARDLAEQELKNQLSRLEMETTRSFVLVEARKRLTAAETAVVRALVDYNKARTQLLYDQGEILEKNSITVDAR